MHGEHTRIRSQSFKEIMRMNKSSAARIPSPKPHRRSHSHHNNGHHHSSSKLNENSNHSNHHHHSNSHDRSHHKSQNLLTRVQSSPNAHMNGFDSYMGEKSPAFLRIDESFGRVRSYSDSNLSRVPSMGMDGGDRGYFRNNSNSSNSSSLSDSPIEFSVPSTQTENVKEIPVFSSKESLQIDTLKGDSKIKQKADKQKILNMIEGLISQTENNFINIENDINETFQRLKQALDNRRNDLITQAKTQCDKKRESLNESKRRCENSRKTVSRQSSVSDNDICNLSNGCTLPNGHKRIRRSSVDDHDDILQENKILEPWRNGDETTDCDSLTKSLNELPNDVFSDLLEEGNLVFKVNEEFIESFTRIGELKENLSSPQLSFVKGLSKGFAIVGDEVKFEVYTRNIKDEFTLNDKDNVEIKIFNSDNENIVVDNMSSKSKLKLKTTLNANKCYQPSFTALKSGLYNIHVKINSVEINDSPISYYIYSKQNLTFDNHIHDGKEDLSQCANPFLNQTTYLQLQKNKLNIMLDDVRQESKQRHKMRRDQSEDQDWYDDSNWIVQKGEKSSLLLSSNEIPSYIFAATEVKGVCAWKIRVTAACTCITLSIGVGTQSGIPDIDERFSCDFVVSESKQNETKKVFPVNKQALRKSSSFTRLSLNYSILLNADEGYIRVVSEEFDEDKQAKINTKTLQQFKLYPFCSMIHHHDNCVKQICPRPQITLV